MKQSLQIIILMVFINGYSSAQVGVGSPAPDFTLNTLNNGQISLSQFFGNVVYLYFLGYNCPPCLAPSGGPSSEFNIWQIYRNFDFQAIGIDCWDGTTSQLDEFRFNTGITYPLCLNGSNVCLDYLAPASFSVVVNQAGQISYMGLGLDLQTVTGVIDSLLGITGIDEKEIVAQNFTLKQNYPNPFNPITTIEFILSEANYVTLKLFNLIGQEISTLISAPMKAGEHSLQWNASSYPAGIYFYRLQGFGFSGTRRMVLLK
jgi:hypothetical protein